MDGEPDPYTRVRVKHDPTQIGIYVGSSKNRNQRVQLRIQFPTQKRWMPLEALEAVEEGPESPTDYLHARRVAQPADVRRALTHVRLSGRLADIIYSMDTTNAQFYSYQFKPVIKMLRSPSNGLLIADEVGLGKTIEAGLIWTELRTRYDFRRLLVLCPASLKEKWQSELHNRMGVRADIVDATQLFNTLHDHSYDQSGFALIGSIQGLRPNRDWADPVLNKSASATLARFLQSHTDESGAPLIDLLIIDEAHYLRNPQTSSHHLGRLLRDVSDHAVLLTATPVHNYAQDLFSALNLLDRDTFQHWRQFERVLAANKPLIDAREAILAGRHSQDTVLQQLDRAHQSPLLQSSLKLQSIRERAASEDLSDHEVRSQLAYQLDEVNLLGHTINRTRKRDVTEWRVIREPYAEHVLLTEIERQFYDIVTRIVCEYCEHADLNAQFILCQPQRLMASCMPAALAHWTRGESIASESSDVADADNDTLQTDLGPLTRELVNQSHTFVDADALERSDSKFRRLITMLGDFVSKHISSKIIIFTSFRPTLAYLSRRLTDCGYRVHVLHGGITDKSEVVEQFKNDDRAPIMVSSEVGGEGLDLQFCWAIINYDLPWNPMRVEQRIGRVDRLGQKADKVMVWNIFYEDTIDSRIYELLYDKLDLCRASLGDFENVLGDEIKTLRRDIIRTDLSADQQAERIEQTAQALENLRREESLAEENASHLIQHGDYILREVSAARDVERSINGADLKHYVLDFLHTNYTGCRFDEDPSDALSGRLILSAQARYDLETFARAKGIMPDTRMVRDGSNGTRCIFENRVAAAMDKQRERISQFHPLVRLVGERTANRQEWVKPAAAITIGLSDLLSDRARGEVGSGVYLIGVAVWSVGGVRPAEKLSFAGVELNEHVTWIESGTAERIAIAAANNGVEWEGVGQYVDFDRVAAIAEDDVFSELENEFNQYVYDVDSQNRDLINFQLRALEQHFEAQKQNLEQQRDARRDEGRESLARANEAKLEKLADRTEQKRLKISEKLDISSDHDDLAVLIVNVE